MADDSHPRDRDGDRRDPALEPMDEHNRALVANVHPPDWENPEPAGRYHLVVIGAGTAGLVSAAGAAGLGARVALVERELMGGDCLNVGCVPSKGVIRAARAWHDAARARDDFAGPAVQGDGDFAAVMERMRRIRAAISPADSAARFSDLGIDVFLGEGRFVASDAVEVDGRRLRFKKAVIATGARAAAPPIPGLGEVDYLTNENLFSLTELPGRFGVVGAGPIGCEMSQAFARLGSEVHTFEMADHVLPREDGDAAAIVQKAMERDGVKLHLGAEIVRVEKGDGGGAVVVAKVDGEERKFPVDQLLISVGRAPNVEGLGLEAAAIEYDPKRGVEVDDRMRTTNRHVFAAGDVASKYQFTHTADAQARKVIRNAFFFGRGKASDLVVPWTTYTSPEIAHVGPYEEEARERGIDVETLTVPLDDNDRALLDGEDEGFLRIHHEKGRVLGGTLVAAHAGDMIGPLVLAATHGLSLSQLSDTIFPYPTQGEVYRQAGDRYNRTRLTPTVKKLFDLWFKIIG